ncbi:MAG: peroxiredoxin family protein [Lautropia sp.]
MLIESIAAHAAPALQVTHWFNTPRPIALEDLRGRVVALHAFQMLCPGCVAHGLPQAARMHELFTPDRLAVIGLHTVFEHHAVMQPPAALQAFIHEYRLAFPIGIDRPDPDGGAVPATMQALGLRGTPSLLLLDKRGRIRLHQFGRTDDLRIGALIGQLIAEPDETAAALCDDRGCSLPETGRQDPTQSG